MSTAPGHITQQLGVCWGLKVTRKDTPVWKLIHLYGCWGQGGEGRGLERRRGQENRENSFPEHMGTCDSPTAYSKHIALFFSRSVVSNSLQPQGLKPTNSSVPGISLPRILEWVAISSSRGSSQPRGRTWVPYIAGEFFTTEPPGKRTMTITHHHKFHEPPSIILQALYHI